ncbi:hypothetical protein ABW19_dt0201036 [Dactylella cylindrospora]|nr:hypothetical protein ABW19_dt0201036 [Dactylella cylindrospora]
MPSTTAILLLTLLNISLSSSLALPQTPTTTANPSTTSVYVDPSGSSSSSVGGFSLNAQIGLICGIVVICLIAVGVFFYGYRKYRQRLIRRRTAIKMDQMQASLNARVQNARRSGMLDGNVLKVYEGKGKGPDMQVTQIAEITVGSPVDQALSALEGNTMRRDQVGGGPRVGIWPNGSR